VIRVYDESFLLDLTGTKRSFVDDHKMKSQVLGLRVAAILFGLLALAQLCRLMIRPDVLVAGHHLPLWPSALALVILGGMSVWMWRLSRMTS
jgi:hypothetical protein